MSELLVELWDEKRDRWVPAVVEIGRVGRDDAIDEGGTTVLRLAVRRYSGGEELLGVRFAPAQAALAVSAILDAITKRPS